MKRKSLMLAIAIAVFGGGATPAAIADDEDETKEKDKSDVCALSLIHPGAISLTASSPYGSFSSAQSTERAPLQIRAEGPACEFAVGFSSPGERSGERRLSRRSDRIAYWLSPERNGVVRLGDDTNGVGDQLLRGRFAGGDAIIDLPYFIIAPGGQPSLAGQFEDRISITLFRAETKRLRRADDLKFRLDLRVEPSIEAVVIADSGSGPLAGAVHSVRLGDLSRGARRDFHLSIRANTDFKVRLESENSGALRHRDLGRAAEIPYELAIDGRRARLNRAFVLDGQEAQSDAVRKTLTVEVAPARDALAGDYSDNLKITISAR